MLQGPTHQDWLVDTLCLAPYTFFVSGSEQTSRNYIDVGLISLRFIGHFPLYMQRPPSPTEDQRRLWLPSHYELMMGFLIVELSTQRDVDAFKATDKLTNFIRQLSNIFHAPIALLAYTKQDRPDGLGICARYWVSDQGLGIEGVIDPLDYAEAINQRRNPSEWEAPEMKPINKTLRDSFQRWTRAYLSTQLSINDIDAFKLITTNTGKQVLIICELKRSNIATETWSPYLDDIPNFMLAKACARMSTNPPVNVLDLTIHYSPERHNELALHVITGVTKENITGFRKIIRGSSSGNTVEHLVQAIASMMDAAYVSTRRLH